MSPPETRSGSGGASLPGPGTPAGRAVPRLLEAYGDRLYQLGLRNCGTRAEAEDLVQETMIQALRSWDSFEGRSRPSTWLFRIALRTCRRMHRRRSGEPERFESLENISARPDQADASPTDLSHVMPGAGLDRRELANGLDAALARIPEDFRMALVLKDIADFSVEEVAAILDIPQATAKTRVHRGRVRLRDALEADGLYRPLPPATVPRQVCLDLLTAKLEAMDRGVPFPCPHGEVCDRCASLFQALDLNSEVCASLRQGSLPGPFRTGLLERLKAS